MRYQSKSNKPPKARENAGDQVVMLLFLHLMGWEWCEFSRPITEQIKKNQCNLK